jgi:hypothetical protein
MPSPLSSLVPSVEQLSLGGRPVRIRKITMGDLMRLLATIDAVRDRLAISRDEITTLGSDKAGALALIARLLTSARADLAIVPLTPDEHAAALEAEPDFEPEPKVGIRPGTVTAEVFGTLASLVGRSALDLVKSDPDELYAVVARFWEVNAEGPLGQAIRHIIAKWAPEMTAIRDLTLANLRTEAMKAAQSGGMPIGGKTEFSAPSETLSDGLTSSSSDTAPADASPSSQASDTRPADVQQPTETQAAPEAQA